MQKRTKYNKHVQPTFHIIIISYNLYIVFPLTCASQRKSLHCCKDVLTCFKATPLSLYTFPKFFAMASQTAWNWHFYPLNLTPFIPYFFLQLRHYNIYSASNAFHREHVGLFHLPIIEGLDCGLHEMPTLRSLTLFLI